MRNLSRKRKLRRPDIRTRAHHVERNLREPLRLDKPIAVDRLLKLRMERARHCAGKNRECIHVPLFLRKEIRDRSTGLLHVVFRLVHGKFIADAGLHAALENVVRLSLKDKVRPSHLQTLLNGAERHILAADLGGERYPRIRKIAVGLGHKGFRLLDAATDAAEYVNLPCGVKTGPERITTRICIGACRAIFAHVRTGCRSYSGDLRHHIGPGARIAPTRLFKALLRHQERAVVGHGVFDKARKKFIVELPPPCADLLGLEFRAGILSLRRRLELAGLRQVGRHRPACARSLQRGLIDRHFRGFEIGAHRKDTASRNDADRTCDQKHSIQLFHFTYNP